MKFAFLVLVGVAMVSCSHAPQKEAVQVAQPAETAVAGRDLASDHHRHQGRHGHGRWGDAREDRWDSERDSHRHGRLNPDACAVIFEGVSFNGARREIMPGDEISDMRDLHKRHHWRQNWNNEAGSVVIMPGCRMTAYQYLDFDINFNNGRQMGGQIRIFTGESRYHPRHIRFIDDGFFKLMSSLQCECDGNER